MFCNANTYYLYLKILTNMIVQYEHSVRPYNIAYHKIHTFYYAKYLDTVMAHYMVEINSDFTGNTVCFAMLTHIVNI